jgi:hypothetical protein
MPRRVGGPHRVARRLTEAQVNDLLYGDPFGAAFDSPAVRRKAWFEHREQLIALFELRDPPPGRKHPRGYVDYEDPCVGYPLRASLPRGLRIMTYEDCRERLRRP